MSNDVLITPASRKIEFKDSGGTVDAKIETDSSGNLTITNPGGDISIGDTTADVFIGDGVNSVDLVFEQSGAIRGTSGVTLTLGDSNTTLRTGTDLSLNSNNITNVGTISSGAITSSAAVVSTALDSGNPQAATDQARFSAYGLMGNRSNLYITNANSSGIIQLGVGGAHNANPALTVSASNINTHGSTITSGAITSSGTGSFNELTLTGGSDNLTFTETAGDWSILNAQQNNGIVIYDGNSGVEIHYNGSTVAEFDNGGGMNLSSGGLRIGNTTVIDSSRKVYIQDGSLSAPALAFESDQDTGFYGGGNNIYGVTGGQKRLTLNATGVSAHNDLVILTGKLKMGTLDVIDSSRNLTNIGTISSGAITANGSLSVSGTALFGNTLTIQSDNLSGVSVLTVDDDANLPSLKIGNTTVIDSTRNITGAKAITITATDSEQTNSADSTTVPDATGTASIKIQHPAYTDGRYTTRIAKIDRSGGLPIYFQESLGTANSYTNVFRVGYHSRGDANTYRVQSFYPMKVDGYIGIGNSSEYIRRHQDSWTNAPEHTVLYNSFKTTLGDYITLKAAGNGTSGHGALVVADNGVFFGRTNIETGDLVANNSVTAPLDANWARIDTSGGLHCSRVTVTSNATPFIFNQADQSNGTVGKWWRMPIDGTSLRFDVSLTGDAAFTTYRDILALETSGNVRIGAGGATDYNRLYFKRYGGASVGAIGWHSDAIFYIGGHPNYGSTAGNDVRVYGFGSDIHIGDNSNGDVITVEYTTGDVLVRAGTAASDPATVRILSTTESNTTLGQYYAGLEFGVVGGEAGSGNFTNGVNSAIRAVDCRDGSTSYEDSGLGFYTMPSTGRTTPALRVAVANEGGMHVMSDSTPLNIAAGNLIVDNAIGIGKDAPSYPLDISTTTGTGINVTDDDGWATIRLDGGGGTDNVLELSNYGNSGSGSLLRTTGTGPLRLFAGNTEALSITANKKVGIGTNNLANSSNSNGVLAIGSAFMGSSASLFVDGFSRYSGPLYVSQNSANGVNYYGLTYANNRLTLSKSGTASSSIDAPEGYYISNTAVITSGRALDNITGLDVDTTTSSAVTFNSSAHSGIKYTLTDTVANQAFYGIHIDYNASGSDACTADRIHAALFIDADSSASGGDTADEHRFYGIYGDVRVSQDSDQVHGSYIIARADNFGTGKTLANVRGQSGLAYGHQDAGTISNVQGGYNYASNTSSGSGIVTSVMGTYSAAVANSTSVNSTNYYGVYGICQVTATQSVNPTSLHGLYGEIQLDNDTAADHAITINNAYVIRAEYDENDTDNSYTVNNAYLFHGNYSGTLPSTAYGIYIADNNASIRNRMGGVVEANDGSLTRVSYGFIGDVNTGMYSPADHELSLATNGTRRININSSGNVGIGNFGTSNEKLSVAGSLATTSGSITSFGNVTAGQGYVQANTAFRISTTEVINSSRQLINLTFNGGSTGVRFARDIDLLDTGNVKRLRFNSSGSSVYNSTNGHFFQHSGVNKAEIQTDGDAIFAGNVTAYGSPSDINLKENIETIPNAVEKVQKLDGVTFNYKKDGKRSTGLIAQQLQEVLPEVVYTAKDLEGEEHLAVRYGNVVGLLVEALKEQQTQIDNLTTLVNKLKEK